MVLIGGVEEWTNSPTPPISTIKSNSQPTRYIIQSNHCLRILNYCQCLHLSNSRVTSNIYLFCSFTGVLILLALGLLTPYFYFIPKASLAAVIICAVIFMIEYEVVKPMWKSSRKLESFVLARTLGLDALKLALTVGSQ
jgi:hypothetical protein